MSNTTLLIYLVTIPLLGALTTAACYRLLEQEFNSWSQIRLAVALLLLGAALLGSVTRMPSSAVSALVGIELLTIGAFIIYLAIAAAQHRSLRFPPTWVIGIALTGAMAVSTIVVLTTDETAESARQLHAVRAFGGTDFYMPAASDGPANEPVIDGVTGKRFHCSTSGCEGPAFPALNAYENHPLFGDEADFVRGVLSSEYGNEGVERYRTVAMVRPGDQLKVRVTMHNSADPKAIDVGRRGRLVAREVRARVMLPVGPGREMRIQVFLGSPTTSPEHIADSLPVRSSQSIRLHLRRGTAAVLYADPFRERLAPATLFEQSDQVKYRLPWGIGVGDIRPSFRNTTYIEFQLQVKAAN